MTSTVFVKFSYENRVSESIPIQVLKSNSNITEVSLTK